MSNIFPEVVKPIVDVLWFTYQTYVLLGGRNTLYLYAYMVIGLGFLKLVTPNLHALVQTTQNLEGDYRYAFVQSFGRSTTISVGAFLFPFFLLSFITDPRLDVLCILSFLLTSSIPMFYLATYTRDCAHTPSLSPSSVVALAKVPLSRPSSSLCCLTIVTL
jgi:hypothetical protein